MADRPEYYIGLDCGTNSVGWAVTDKNYEIQKFHGWAMWGSRLFDAAEPAKKRRSYRTSRRRKAREQRRIRLLRQIFKPEIDKLDPDFYDRIDQSFYRRIDKKSNTHGKINTKYSLFADERFTDKDYHDRFPTIWHLRKALIDHDLIKLKTPISGNNVDARFYYLGLAHMMRHRGHFLIEGELDSKDTFSEAWGNFARLSAKTFTDIKVDEGMRDKVKGVLVNVGLSSKDKCNELKKLKFATPDENAREDVKAARKKADQLVDLIAGRKCNLSTLLGIAGEESKNGLAISVASNKFDEIMEEKVLPLTGADDNGFNLISAAKTVYDCAYLEMILEDEKLPTYMMVNCYDRHRADLSAIRSMVSNGKDFKRNYVSSEWSNFFEGPDGSRQGDGMYNLSSVGSKVEYFKYYPAYIGKGFTVSRGRRKHIDSSAITQESVSKYITDMLHESGTSDDGLADAIIECEMEQDGVAENKEHVLGRIRSNSLLPKQRGYAKGSIPRQLYEEELDKILCNMQKDFPEFLSSDEPFKDGVPNVEKISALHSFRVPYYCGPMLTKSSKVGGSGFCWADGINEVVYPWNYDEVMKERKNTLAKRFVGRLVKECTYLSGEKALPNDSILYQRYKVLECINNLSIVDSSGSAKPIDQETKVIILTKAFEKNELEQYKYTAKGLKEWAKNNLGVGLTGMFDNANLPQLSTEREFKRVLGAHYSRIDRNKYDVAVEAICALKDDQAALSNELVAILGCTDEEAKNLAKLQFKGYGKLSRKLLNGIRIEYRDDRSRVFVGTVIGIMEDNVANLAKVKSSSNLLEIINRENEKAAVSSRANASGFSFDEVEKLTTSPSVKRSVWQALKVVEEIKRARGGQVPEKIFIEATKVDKAMHKNYAKVNLSRRNRLIEKYKKITGNEDAKNLLAALQNERSDRDLLKKKLYLYYIQMGKCAYTAEPISLGKLDSDYDIDHIYPKAKTGDGDDSLENNLVLVKKDQNENVKKDEYPIPGAIRNKSEIRQLWSSWHNNGLINDEKYKRLMRDTPLSNEELEGFIQRQIVETGQTAKILKQILEGHFPKSKVVFVRAERVSNLRQLYGYNGDELNGLRPMPEFIKIRDLNDLHHAKDAYLNIVVGDVLYEPLSHAAKFIKANRGHYSLSTRRVFRNDQERFYKSEEDKASKKTSAYPKKMGNWNWQESIDIMSKWMKRDGSIIVTKMLAPNCGTGSLFNQQAVGAKSKMPKGTSNDNAEKIVPAKRYLSNKTFYYGGLNGINGAYFSLVEYVKEGRTVRELVQIPVRNAGDPKDFLESVHPGVTIVRGVIRRNSLIKVNGAWCRIAGQQSSGIIIAPAEQLRVSFTNARRLKAILSTCNKVLGGGSEKDGAYKYKIDSDKDRVNDKDLDALYDELADTVSKLPIAPGFDKATKKLINARDKFVTGDLSPEMKCIIIRSILKAYACNTDTADLTKTINNGPEFMVKSGSVGKGTINKEITKYKEFLLLDESTTGLYNGKPIDLLTVQPGEVKF